MIIQNPLFLLLIPLAFLFIFYSRRRSPGIRFSSERFLKIGRSTIKAFLSRYLWVLRLLVFIFLALSLCRIRVPLEESPVQTEGIDIVLALDTSTSMLAEDFSLDGKRVNRLDAVKDVVEHFIEGRKSDRVGIVAFAARAYTVSPLTLDYGWLAENLKRVRIGMIEDGTAIGMGLSVALNRLKDTRAKSKVVILLTDGINNTGRISPALAAETAKSLGVRVYTVGAGSKGLAPYPMRDFFGNTVYQQVKIEIDDQALKDIAGTTGGKYFRATDTKSLKDIYSEIDRMEKTSVEEKGYTEYRELFPGFLSIALVFLLSEVILTNTVLRRVP